MIGSHPHSPDVLGATKLLATAGRWLTEQPVENYGDSAEHWIGSGARVMSAPAYRLPTPLARLVILALVAVFGLQVVMLHRRTLNANTSLPVATKAVVGDRLPDIPLLSGSTDDSGDHHATSFHQLLRSPCSIVVFFSVSCPITASIAPTWREVHALPIGDHHVPIAWVSVDVDTAGIDAFLKSHSLASAWYAVVSPADRRRLGVAGWPTVWAVDDKGQLRGELPQSLARIRSQYPDSLSTWCRRESPTSHSIFP